MLKVENVELQLPNFHLKEISFEVKENQICALLGPNGSGKTSLLNCIAGIYSFQKGNIYLNDHDIKLLSSKRLAQLIGYLPQKMGPSMSYAVREFVVTGLANQIGLFGCPQKRHYQKVLDCLQTLGISYLKDRFLKQLSGGEMQLVRLARVLVKGPKILLLDEPTTYLDLKNQVKIMNTIKGLAQKGITTLISLHDPNLASLYVDQIVLLKSGKILAQGATKTVLKKELIEELYEMPIKVIDVDGLRLIVGD